MALTWTKRSASWVSATGVSLLTLSPGEAIVGHTNPTAQGLFNLLVDFPLVRRPSGIVSLVEFPAVRWYFLSAGWTILRDFDLTAWYAVSEGRASSSHTQSSVSCSLQGEKSKVKQVYQWIRSGQRGCPWTLLICLKNRWVFSVKTHDEYTKLEQWLANDESWWTLAWLWVSNCTAGRVNTTYLQQILGFLQSDLQPDNNGRSYITQQSLYKTDPDRSWMEKRWWLARPSESGRSSGVTELAI